MSSRRRITAALIGLLVLVGGGWLVRDLSSGNAGAATTALSALPPEAGQTWRLIERGGPFPYPRNDGVVFTNREKRLPDKQSGYYHEYTVPTPGSTDRGPRRLITGAGHELYYTGDHYASFVVVDPSR
ncbi:ribonuclease domain-containing protein [Amycolatopsis pithecellobii]|uniref:Ribonuclease N n=1 Tax=Amycolatopsis pithecellobii TaxID=664692 RepID=A0A6N7ZB08_9PSEU|nr:ribonuclease domain-containing protein [Amycolatopsis pithecellobii]MTD58878.1 ribonuclease N [Amycolatopsis pithecellobii]